MKFQGSSFGSIRIDGSFKVNGTSNEPSSDPNDPEIVITPNGSGGSSFSFKLTGWVVEQAGSKC